MWLSMLLVLFSLNGQTKPLPAERVEMDVEGKEVICAYDLVIHYDGGTLYEMRRLKGIANYRTIIQTNQGEKRYLSVNFDKALRELGVDMLVNVPELNFITESYCVIKN